MAKTSGQTRFKLLFHQTDPTAQQEYMCANCARPLTGPNAFPRGSAIAWHGCCRDCDELAAKQMELAMDQPSGAAIQVYRCRQCGDLRSCRPGWRTRCHVCLDERTDVELLEENSQECLAMFGNNPLLALQAGRNLNLSRGEPITAKAIVQATACLSVATQLARYERPGWTVIAADVWGLPWRGIRSRPTSHGTWGQHDACGAMVDEAVIHRVVGGASVMRRQLRHLVDSTQQGKTTIQVMPYSAGAHAGTTGPFVILDFDEPTDPVVVYVETLAGDIYLEERADVNRYILAFDRLRAASLHPDDSVQLIEQVASTLA